MTPASIRNRNPGAMYPGPSAKRFGSRSFEVLRSRDGVHKIATFPTCEHGVAALFDLLARKYVGLTVEAAIRKWCGGYYVSTYLKVLEEKAGISAATKLELEILKDPEKAILLAKAMALQEAGREYPLDDDGWREGHAMAFGGSVAPSYASDNDVPSPKPETRMDATIKAVAKPALIGGGGVVGIGTISEMSSTLVAVKGNAGQLLSGIDLTTWAVPVLIVALACGVIAYLRRYA